MAKPGPESHLSPSAYTELGPLRQAALLQPAGHGAGLQGGRDGLEGGGGCVGGGVVPLVLQLWVPVGLSTAEGGLVAGLRGQVGRPSPRAAVGVGDPLAGAGVQRWRGLPGALGWFGPRPRPVLLPVERGITGEGNRNTCPVKSSSSSYNLHGSILHWIKRYTTWGSKSRYGVYYTKLIMRPA